MKVGTYGQKLYFTAKDENGEPIDLTTAQKVIAHAKIGDYPKKTFQCTIEDPEKGIVSYILKEGDLDNHGIMYIELELIFPDAKFISDETFKIKIKKTIT